MSLTIDEKVELIASTYVTQIELYCKQNKLNLRGACEKLLRRKASVRVAKMANFSISGVAVKDILTDEEDLFHATNRAYGLIRSHTEVSIDSVKDDELLAKLQA